VLDTKEHDSAAPLQDVPRLLPLSGLGRHRIMVRWLNHCCNLSWTGSNGSGRGALVYRLSPGLVGVEDRSGTDSHSPTPRLLIE